MGVFYATLASTFFLGLGCRISEDKKLFRCLFILLAISVFTAVAGLRNNIGDTGTYMRSYTLLENWNGVEEGTKDIGFIYFQLFLRNINTDPQFFIFITSFITQFLTLYTFYKYRSYIELELFMYITCSSFLVSMNGIRQAMVASILFICTKLIEDRKFVPYLIVTIILSYFHSSAIIMIAAYFIAIQESWNKKTFIIIVLALLAFLFFYELAPALFDMLGDSSYSEYADSIMEGGQGANVMRVIVNAVPVILAYVKRNELSKCWQNSNIFVNMSLINLIVMMFSTYHWIFARFDFYFKLYNIVLIPYLIKYCFEKKDRDLIYFLFIVCYFIYFYYEQVIGGIGLGYSSNFINIY